MYGPLNTCPWLSRVPNARVKLLVEQNIHRKFFGSLYVDCPILLCHLLYIMDEFQDRIVPFKKDAALPMNFLFNNSNGSKK